MSLTKPVLNKMYTIIVNLFSNSKLYILLQIMVNNQFLISFLILFAVDLNTTNNLLAQASGQDMANMHYRKYFKHVDELDL